MPARTSNRKKRNKNRNYRKKASVKHKRRKILKKTEISDTKRTKNETETNKILTNNELQTDKKVEIADEENKETEEQKKETEKRKILQLHREQSKLYGEQFFQQQSFQIAMFHFEQALSMHGETSLPPLNNELDLRSKLLVCRLHHHNSDENLVRALQICTYLLQYIPTSSQHWIIKAELFVRLQNFGNAGECLLKAAEMDQPSIIPSVHLYLRQLNKNIAHIDNDCILNQTPFSLPSNITIIDICKFFYSLTSASKQNIMSVEWQDIIHAIDSDLLTPLLPAFLSDEQVCELRIFLKKALNWNLSQNISCYLNDYLAQKQSLFNDNLPQNSEDIKKQKNQKSEDIKKQEVKNQELFQKNLIFLKVEYAYVLARTLWSNFPLPSASDSDLKTEVKVDGITDEKKEKCIDDETEIKTIDKAIALDCESTYFLDNGLFGCRDGYEFMASSLFEPSPCLTSILDINCKKPLPTCILDEQWMQPSGIRLLFWLCNSDAFHMSEIANEHYYNSDMDDEWSVFLETRIHSYFSMDPSMNDTSLPKEAQKDSKKFENFMEKIVGKEKKDTLMHLELEMSLPILKKYAQIMSAVSGIDEDILMYELTLPDEDDNTDDSTALSVDALLPYLVNDQFSDYHPIGLPSLIQTATFNLDIEYDRSCVLNSLALLEKEVVQFQINYKKRVFEVIGNDAQELNEVMNTLQYRGLELTKWLRNFVKYMIARRDMEQEILLASKKCNAKSGLKWFESMTNYLLGANNILLRLISRMLMRNLSNACNTLLKVTDIKDMDNLSKNFYCKMEMEYGKIETIGSKSFEIDCLLKFFPMFKKIFNGKLLEMDDHGFSDFTKLKNFVDGLLKSEEMMEVFSRLKKDIHISHIRVPLLQIAIPVGMLDNINSVEYKPWMSCSQTHKILQQFRMFLERNHNCKDIILCLVYSTNDHKVALFRCFSTNLHESRMCSNCSKMHAQQLCKNCNLARYCCSECQIEHWKTHSKHCKSLMSQTCATSIILWK